MSVGRGSTGPISGYPTAICGNPQIGLPVCSKGSGQFCYSMKVCSSQMRMDNPKVRTREAQRMYDMEKERTLEYAKEYARDHDLDDRKLDEVVDELINLNKPWNRGGHS